MAQSDQAPDDKLLAGILLCPADHAAVDLYNADLRQIQHFKAGGLGAEIIDAQQNVSLAQGIEQIAQGFQLNAVGGFCDLKQKP